MPHFATATPPFLPPLPFFTAAYTPIATRPRPGMVYILPGTFMMGSPEGEAGRYGTEGPQTEVTLTHGFWVGTHEVTQREYQKIMGSNPSWFQPPNAMLDLDRPVEQVTWHEAVAYCATLTEQEHALGLTPSDHAYRLPTEAEWEYACRAGRTTRFSFGDDPDYTQLADYAWYGDNSDSQTHPVGQKLPNAWGLHGMHGNVWEWCQDWMENSHPGGSVVDPQGPATGDARVVRGGLWSGAPRDSRSARRDYGWPDRSGNYIGFRVVLAPAQP